MRIVKDSGVEHWILATDVECRRCQTVFRAETKDDFEDHYESARVYLVCPKCGEGQRVFRPWSEQSNQYTGAGDGIDMSIPLN